MAIVKTSDVSLPSYRSIAEFLARSPLYSDLVTGNWDGLRRVSGGDYGVDAHCKLCGRESTFVFDGRVPDGFALSPGATFTLYFKCPRCQLTKAYFALVVESMEKIKKIGQLPSVADCAHAELRTYDKFIEAEQVADLRHAVGLASHGVGAGSLIYLRRIFERLIKQAYEVAKLDPGWNEDAFTRARMSDRIKMLSQSLPRFLVDNSEIYGILSAGVHNLTEEQCKNLFPVVRTGIELILDEQMEKRKREKKIKSTADELAKLKADLAKLEFPPTA